MSLKQAALDLAAKGFHVFPLVSQKKVPLIPDFPAIATRDPRQIELWWHDLVLDLDQPHNVGISTTKFNGGQSGLVVVDVDNKGIKRGSDVIVQLEFEGYELPSTYTQQTPTGGLHLVYKYSVAVKQGVDVLGVGLDIRSKGGYIVGAGSLINGTPYTANNVGISEAPAWVIERCGAAKFKETVILPLDLKIDAERAMKRAKVYLETEAPLSIKGQGGDATAYKVAAHLKDLGLAPEDALDAMLNFWNDRCPPGWSVQRLKEKVDHAYRYGLQPKGSSVPELQFDPVPTELHPLDKLNEEFAFVLAGGGSHILWETVDHKDQFKLEHISVLAFHQKLASKMLKMGYGRSKPISKIWMNSDKRRSYDGICFSPGVAMPPQFYNLWRGFAVEPLTSQETATREMKASLQSFLDHARENVCRGDEELFHWLMGYFAHIVQKPAEKPLVALVFRGNKGVGKNALVDRVGHLLGNHYLLTSNRRYLTSNFNAHLENLLLFALDEAFWSGDKQAEGTLKDLITGQTHVIEHKGKEPYSVDNCTRVVIIGNEEWLVPASQDERRYAVFDVGEGKKQNRNYFQTMREGMERGGYRLLLRYLLDYDLKGIDINDAPSTKALMDQKVNSLEPFHQWWLDCLTDGKIVCSDFSEEWPSELNKDRFRWAFKQYVKDRQIRSRISGDIILGKLLKSCLPSVDGTSKRREGGGLVNIYKMPSLEQARKEWSKFIGHPVSWE